MTSGAPRGRPLAMTSRSVLAVATLIAAVVAFLVGVALGSFLWTAPEGPPPERLGPPAPLESVEEPRVPSPAAEAPEATPRGPLPEPYPTRLDRATIDLTGDGSPEVVELYAAVERDTRGRLMWDDGQRWMLVVHAGDPGEGFLLFDDFVQIGRLSFWAIETVEPLNELVLEVATGAGVRVWRVQYDPVQDAFVERESVSASGNVIHRTPADLE
jgi:hypothetical protein